MKVIVREAAAADLDRIHAWIAKDNPRAAYSVIERILDAAERLGGIVSRTRCSVSVSERCTADPGPRLLSFRRKEIGVPGLHPPSLKFRRASEQARHSLGDGGQRTAPLRCALRCARDTYPS